jgi:1-acyl-sn-glycerol-3-phosphate acyltransferase
VDDWKYQPAHDLGLDSEARRKSVVRESGLIGLVARNVWWWWVRGVLKLTEHVEVTGCEHLPDAAPFVMVANHASHLDVMVLATALPLRLRNRVLPLAAGDTFFETPVISIFAAEMMNALPMWRKNCGRHAIETLRDRLVQEPCAYILFPEGTRSRDGKMGPFKHGIGMIVAGSAVPVIPCHLSGTFEALPPAAKWPRRKKITLHIGQPQSFASLPNDRNGWKVVAEQLEAAVRTLREKTLSNGTSF